MRAEPALWQFREFLLQTLVVRPIDSVRLAKSFQAFVDDAGKEAERRRERLRTAVGFAMELYRGVLRSEGSALSKDATLAQAVYRIQQGRRNCAGEQAVIAIDACLTTLEYIDRNANLALVVQKWCEDMADLWTLSP